MSALDSSSRPKLHLCVLVHGLWGHPKHLSYLSSQLRMNHSEDVLHILVAKNNSGNHTYDGIERGAERLAVEIEDEIESLKTFGKDVTKFSIVGYSLGGLVSRYAIGLLYSRKLFESIQPMNFTTIATPHLGVRTPMMGWHSQMWNSLGSRTLSSSGQQLFLVDNFRDTQRPLLSILADTDSIFIHALLLFKNRSLYANIVNDRSVPFYTSFIAKTDPFVDTNAVEINYVPGYEDVMLDSEMPVRRKPDESSFSEALSKNTLAFFNKTPYYLFLSVFLPLGVTYFLVNSGIQSYQSAQRIREHESGKSGISVGDFRIPLIEAVQKSTDAAFEHLNALHEEEFDTEDDESASKNPAQSINFHEPDKTAAEAAKLASDAVKNEAKSQAFEHDFPTLALTTDQFRMIDSLNQVGFAKFPVHIHKATHSHAAIVLRMDRDAFSEGRQVSRHWLEHFEL